MTLNIDDGSNQVPVGELALIAGNQQVALGNLERNLILRTLGSVQVQVGNKFYSLPFSTTDTSVTVGDVNAPVIVLTNTSDLTLTTYPGDGYLIYVKQSKSLFIAMDGSYLLINQATTITPGGGQVINPNDKVYLSFVSEQTLTGAQKATVLLNSGYFVSSLASINTYAATDAFVGQAIYSIAEQRHYRLIDANNPSQATSWKEIYLNLDDGGIVNGPVVIDIAGGSTKSFSALHIPGSYTANRITTPPTVDSSIFVLGALDYSTGLAMFDFQDTTYFQALKAGSGFQFLTTSIGGTQNTPLAISRNNVGIGGPVNAAYTLNVKGNSNFSGLAYFNSGIGSSDFISGPNGTGYNLTLDTDTNEWTLEVDKVIERDKEIQDANFNSKSIDGSFWSNPSVKISGLQNIDYIDVYTKAHKIGNYKLVTGVQTRIPFSERLTYGMCDAPTDETDSGSARLTRTINLDYGLGYMDSSSVDLAYDTYLLETDGVTYDMIQGNYSLVGGSFVSDPAGIYVLSQVINIMFIETANIAMCSAGDLLYYVEWGADGQPSTLVLAVIQSVNSDGCYVYVYSGILTTGMELIKIGNKTGSNNSIHYNGIDPNGDYIESLSNINSYVDIFNNYWTNEDGYEQFPLFDYKINSANIRAKLGNLESIVNTSLGLSNSNQIGLYSDNAYLHGNFVVANGTYLDVGTVVGTYNPFVMITSGNKLQQIDMSGKITYWNAKADNTITITATGNGIAGGGDLTANRTFNLDFTYLDGRYLIQSDWNEADNTKTDYIKNKPAIYTFTGTSLQYTKGDGTYGTYSAGYTFTGTSAQYTKGDGTYATFPTNVSTFTNDSGYLTSASSFPWANVTGRPTTLSGYGITDAYSSTNPSGYISGNQTITLTGAVTGTGTTAIATTLANGVVGIANHSATGTPSATTYLRGDNTWATVAGGGGTPANPTASVGLTAVNGSATTYMRSDGAPPIDQAIIPDWTAIHTWGQNGLGATTASAIVLLNTTAATSSIQQYSPSLTLTGQGWSTTSSASQTVSYQIYAAAASGTTNPTGFLEIASSLNGGAYTNIVSISSGGLITGTAGLSINGPIQTSSTLANSNLYVTGATVSVPLTSAQYQFASSTTANIRSAFYGSSSTSINASANYASVIFANTPATTPATGTNVWLTNVAVKALGTVTIGGTIPTNSASLYIDGASTQATNNYALYVASGTSTFGGTLNATAGLSTGNGSSSNLFANTISAAFATPNTTLIYGGGANVYTRVLFNGLSSTVVTTGNTYANVIVGASPLSTGAAITTAWASNFLVQPIGVVSLGAGSTLTNTASVYINGVSTAGTNNYAIYSTGGASILNGTLLVNSTVPNGYTFEAVGGTSRVNNLAIGIVPGAVQSAASTATTGGTLAAGTYYYKIVSMDSNFNQSTPGNEVNITTTGTTSTVTLTWTAAAGAVTYRVYRGTAAGAENVYYATSNLTYTDTGAAGTSASLPTVNFTGVTNLLNDGSINGYKFGQGPGSASSTNLVIGSGSAMSHNTSGGQIISLGVNVLPLNTTGSIITAIGYQALQANTTGSQIIAIGAQAGYGITTGQYNIAIGNSTMGANQSFSIGIGMQALQNSTGGQNHGVGTNALYYNTTGANNIANGYQVGMFYGGVSSQHVTAIDNSVLLGYQAGPGGNSQTNQIVIGYNAIGNGSNTATIGNSSTTGTYLSGDIIGTATIRPHVYTVATLPTAGTLGRIAIVSDATAPTYLGTLTGGGTVKTPVFDNGTAWVSF